jgi:hypothetical protein
MADHGDVDGHDASRSWGSEARASACVSIYSLMFVSLPFRTVMAKTQWSSNVLFVALTFPVAKPTTRTRSPCATYSRGSGIGGLQLGSLLKQIRQSRVPAVRAGQRPVLARNDPLNIFGAQRQQALLIAAADRGEEVLHGLDVLLGNHRHFSISVGTSCSSVELDQVLEDQLTPAISARLDQQPTFREPAKFDRRETEIFRKRTNLRCGAVIVARQ